MSRKSGTPNWCRQLYQNLTDFQNYFTVERGVIVNKTHIIYPTIPNVCCRTTCGKLKFKFATSCAPDRRLVHLLCCSSVSQRDLIFVHPWVKINGGYLLLRHTPVAAAISRDARRVRRFPIFSTKRTAHLHTRHATLCDFLSSQHPHPLPSARQRPSYGDYLELKREYYQNCSVLDCVT